MKASNVLQWLAHICKWCGFLMLVIPPIMDKFTAKQAAIATGVFAGASLLKDTVIKIGDLIDDGKQNNSFKIEEIK